MPPRGQSPQTVLGVMNDDRTVSLAADAGATRKLQSFPKKLGTPQDPDGGLGVCCARPRDRSRQATEHRLSWFASISTANLLTSGPRRRRRKLPPKVDPSRVDSYAELSRIYADRAEWSSSKRFCSRFPSRSRMTWPVSQSGRATHGPELGSFLSRTVFPRLTSWLRSRRKTPGSAGPLET
jgi:hypothetical protein